jgi:hypothetical protein
MCSVSVTPERLTPSIIDKEPVSEWQHVALDPVVAHEQPTRQTLVDVGAAIGQGRLRDLRREGMYVAQQQAIEGLASLLSG